MVAISLSASINMWLHGYGGRGGKGGEEGMGGVGRGRGGEGSCVMGVGAGVD